ncbi:MAG: type IV-A pilus assembly ATPase PilB [Gammaproteobacteria bacterium]|nr:type IV-A pilus assembly ATPase PilB [Gammaproteobacteria bacterium]MDH5727690.1 type IV-A pilus assembly ATPase PilB [Gammaproteobacteria bacterium]
MGVPGLSGLTKRIIDAGLLSPVELKRAQSVAKQQDETLVQFLINHVPVDSLALAHTLSDEFGIPLLDLNAVDLNSDIVDLVDDRLIEEFHALPLWKRGKRLFVAISDPANLQALDQFQFNTGLNAEPILVDAQQLKLAISEVLDSQDRALTQLMSLDLDDLEFAGLDDEPKQLATPSEAEIDDAPLVRFVNKVLVDAIHVGASDIHFEPYEGAYRIRFRIDGVLEERSSPPVNLAMRLASRIKVMARLDISERRLPQDGRIKLRISRNRSIDFRVSTCPTLYGEKIVLRILDSGGLTLGVDVLGFMEAQKKLFLDAIHKPHGMVLVTGPTGSGKTVTLYNALNLLNTNDRNISSVEDPAEIYMPGINQVNVNPKIKLSFASALRSFLRQDPDIIMVGEIRDTETAEIAIKASQTGHMVLSTLHTNDAPQSLSRLLNMGVEAYNIASAVKLIVAQRLVRRLCNHCKQVIELDENIMLAEGFVAGDIGQFNLYTAVGCEHCYHGYRGREGIFQVMPVSEAMQQIILSGGHAQALAAQAEAEGVMDLRTAGLEKVKAGITSLDEINRVTMD